MQAVRARVSDDFVVGVRLSPVDTWARRGLLLNDSIQVAKWLVEDGADFIHLSLRDASGPAPFEPEITIPVATAFRQALPGTPLLSAGGIWDANDLNAAFEAGVDVGVVGRAAIGNPDWATRVFEAGYQPARPPWTVEHLKDAAVGPAFLDYLNGMAGLVIGGKPQR